LRYLLSGGLVARSLAGPIEKSDLVVEDGRVGGDPGGAERIDVSGCVVVPGHVCAHHHLYSHLARGMPGPAPAPTSFLEILERVWWRLDRALDHETIHLSALAGAVEAVLAGTTTVLDHHSSPEAIDGSLDGVAEGLVEAGVRGVVCYEVTDRHGPSVGDRGVSENARFLASNRHALVRGMVGAHASFTIGPATMDALVAAARDAGAPIHIHLAEDELDERDSLDRYGVRVARRLERAGALAEGDLVAHGVRLDGEEIALLRSSGAWLAHNPRSNMNNGVGYAPAARMGERVALGSDGIDGDMFAEARACYLRAREADLSTAPSLALDRLATGAAVAGASFGEPLLGKLEPRAPADLAVLEYGAPTRLDSSNLAGHYVFGLGSRAVRDVMVAGRWIVRNRRHRLLDEDELAARCRGAAERLWRNMESW
jgi:putative selenium metabolism protein SsnA